MTERLPDWLMHRAATIPEAEAAAAGGARFTYRELDARVDATAAGLAAAGIGPGARVGVLSWNTLEMLEVIHAVPRLGATLVPLNARLTPRELAWQANDADIVALLVHPALGDLAEEVAKAAGLGAPISLPVRGDGPYPRHTDHAASDVHSIIYTSGTTGRPKGAMLTFGNFWWSAVGSAFNLGVVPSDRWLACLPLFHVGGLSIALRSAIYGTSIVLQARFDERDAAHALRHDRITLISVVATMLQRILDADPGEAPTQLRAVLVGGGPVPRPLLDRALDLGYPVVQTYGLTEAASQVATLAPADARSRAGSAGKPLLTSRLRVDAPPGEPGEILVSGPTVTPGYFRNREATEAAIRAGWLHTGDIGRLDEEGYLYVLDRRDDLIVTGGENVYPAEVEAALATIPGVEAAAVVGVPDAAWGQLVVAAIVGKNPPPDAEILLALRERLASYKVPRLLIHLDGLPATASGKVQRHLVRDLVLDRLGRRS